MVSEPKMVTQLLDRQMYPDSIDKAPLYNMMDQARPLCSFSRVQTVQKASRPLYSWRSAFKTGAHWHGTGV